MFTHNCSECERRQLIFPSQVTAVRPAEAGIAYHFVCWCGAAQDAVEITDRAQTVRIA